MTGRVEGEFRLDAALLQHISTLTEADDVLIVEMYIRRSGREGFLFLGSRFSSADKSDKKKIFGSSEPL